MVVEEEVTLVTQEALLGRLVVVMQVEEVQMVMQGLRTLEVVQEVHFKQTVVRLEVQEL
jgi:nitrate reductase NapAB chaperone NapD